MEPTNNKIENDLQRNDLKFIKELKEIQEARKKSGIDKATRSIRALTSLIPKHNFWPQMKEEMIEFNFNENE